MTTPRMNISVPGDLLVQMRALDEQPNWSAMACERFVRHVINAERRHTNRRRAGALELRLERRRRQLMLCVDALIVDASLRGELNAAETTQSFVTLTRGVA